MSEWETTEGDHWAANADRYTKMLAGFEKIVSDAAGYSPGERVLDVGCGSGDVTLAAARAATGSGSALGLDLSRSMLSVAEDRATNGGLRNLRFTVADASTFRPDPAGFDVVVSRFGVMFFEDPTTAFAHLRSLMSPGGRLAFVCWQDLFVNDWMMVPGAAVAEVLPLPETGDANAPGPFTFANPERITSILSAAGFTRPEAKAAVTNLWMGSSAEDAASFLRTTGLGRAVFDGADPALQNEAMARATAALVPYQSDAGVELGGAAWLITAST